MPRIRRRFLIDPTEVGTYHCINRCVRRSFLCGDDVVPGARASNKGCLPMPFAEYLDLLDWTGRQLREDKRGAIPQDLAPILERLQIDGEGWFQLIGQFRSLFRRAAGRPHSMQREREQRGCRLMQGIRNSRAVFF